MRIIPYVRHAAILLLCLLAFPRGASAGCTPPSVSITGTPAFCSGGDTTLTANVAGGVAPYAYQWLRNNALLLGEESDTLLVTAPGSYSVVVTDAASCANQAPAVTVVENAPPLVDIQGPDESCAGTPVTLDAGEGFADYLWSTGDTTRFITVSPAVTTDYDVTVTDGNGCSGFDAHTITITPNPTTTIDAPPSVCNNSGGNVASVPFQPGALYDWIILNGAITGGQGTPAITFDAGPSGDVEIGLQIDNGACVTTGAVTIPITEPFLEISGPTSVCPNVPFLLSATSGFVTYQWSTEQNGQFINVVQVDEEVTYSVTAVDENGCSATASITVTLTANPDATIDAPFFVLSRSNDNVASVIEQPGAAYTWQIANGTIVSGDGTHSIVFEAGTAGEIELGVSVNLSGCVASSSQTIVIDEPFAEGIDLSVTKSAPEIVRAGGTFVYTIVVRNHGEEDVAGTFTDELPRGVQFIGVNAGTWNCFGTASVACSGVVEAGASSTIAITVTAPQQTGTITNSVTVTSPTPDPDAGDNTASVDTIITAAPPTCATTPPSLLAPANNAVVPSANVTFSWTAVPGAQQYELWLVRDGGATFAAATPLTSITRALASGATGWYVVARLAAGCDALISSERTVVVPESTGCSTSAAQLIAPAAGSQQPALVQFSWNAIAGAIGYRLWISVDHGPWQNIGGTSGPTTLAALLPAGSITAFIDTDFAGCPGSRSQTTTFTVVADACAGRGFAALSAPDNNAVLDSSDVEFRWIPAPNSDGSRVWASVDGGAPRILGTTDGATLRAHIPHGEIVYWIESLYEGCASTESPQRFRFVVPASEDCPLEGAEPIFPIDDDLVFIAGTEFEWIAAPGATGYEVWLALEDGAFSRIGVAGAGATTLTRDVPPGELRWFLRTRFDGCDSIDAEVERFRYEVPEGCGGTVRPAALAPADSAVLASPVDFVWETSPDATHYEVYVVRENAAPSLVATSTIGHALDVALPDGRAQWFVRAFFGGDCSALDATPVAFEVVARPAGCAPMHAPVLFAPAEVRAGQIIRLVWTPDPAATLYQLQIASRADFADARLITTAATQYERVAELGPPLYVRVRAIDDRCTPPTSSIYGPASVIAVIAGEPQAIAPYAFAPKTAPPPDALIVPAVANAAGINARFRSDVRIANTSAQVIRYQLTYVPTGPAGMQAGRQLTLSIEPGQTLALDDVLRSWFGTGSENAIGTLEIRPLTQTEGADVTFATSRTYNATADGTFGQYIPAVPFAEFAALGEVLSLQQIAQSSKYRTNLGIVEGAGHGVTVEVRVFDGAGHALTAFDVRLNGGEHTQLNAFLFARGIALEDGRVEVEVVDGSGRITAYASVLDNETSDAVLVTPVALGALEANTKWIVPGVADLRSGFADWQTDARIFNAGDAPVTVTATFHSQNGGAPVVKTLTIAPGTVRALDKLLPSLFGVTNDGGAMHLTTAAPARLVVTARTYNQTAKGTYGQFISAVTPEEAAGVGDRALQILQVEESPRFRSNIGFVEVAGRPVTLEVTVTPDNAAAVTTIVALGANEFRQIGSMLLLLGLGDTTNARISVRAIAGEGRATVYASVIDLKTNDPAYFPGQ